MKTGTWRERQTDRGREGDMKTKRGTWRERHKKKEENGEI